MGSSIYSLYSVVVATQRAKTATLMWSRSRLECRIEGWQREASHCSRAANHRSQLWSCLSKQRVRKGKPTARSESRLFLPSVKMREK